MVNDQELKAGRAPAEKVGGVRRVRTPSKGSSSEQVIGGMATAEEPASEEVVATTTSEQEQAEEKDMQVAEGGVVSAFKENTPEAVKAFHEKPMPTKNIQIKNPPHAATNMNIQQPRK